MASLELFIGLARFFAARGRRLDILELRRFPPLIMQHEVVQPAVGDLVIGESSP